MAGRAQPFNDPQRCTHVGQEAHALPRPAGSDFLVRQPCRVLNGLLNVLACEVGYPSSTSSHVAPWAIWATITDTGIRIPRMQARPHMMFGSNVILSNMASSLVLMVI